MGSKLLPSGSVNAANNAPLYGTVILNLVEETEAAVIAAVRGDTDMGIAMGFLTEAPTFNVNRETLNILEPIFGLAVRLKGSEQLQSEEGTVELSFVPSDIDIIRYALPGTTKADHLSATTASKSVGTGNSQHTVRALEKGVGGNSLSYAVVVPPTTTINGAASVSVTGTAPNQTITFTSATDGAGAASSTANDAIRLINDHATAKTLVQAGKPSTSDGTGIVVASAASALAGGTAGTRIGYVLTSQGSWTLADYIRTVHVAWESTTAKVSMLGRIKNAISMENFSFSGAEEVSGISTTLTATADEDDYQPNTGSYAGPFAFIKFDDVAA